MSHGFLFYNCVAGRCLACLFTELPVRDIDGDDLLGDNRHGLWLKNDELVARAGFSWCAMMIHLVVIGRVIVSAASGGKSGAAVI